MEDILQSIKRIIAEEGDPVPPATTDVLELTEMLAEDGSVSQPSTEPEPPAPETLSLEEIMAAPVSSEPPLAAMPEPEPMMPTASMPKPGPEEMLISDATREASAAALSALKHPAATPVSIGGMGFRSGHTVEDLVLEALRPMLKDWLDTHLTGIVERLVEREIRRLGGQ